MRGLQLRLQGGPMHQREIETLEEALKGLRYGTVQLTVHDGKLVRIERLEKIRLPTEPIEGREEQPTG